MKITDYKQNFLARLAPLYGPEEADSFFRLLLEDRRGLKRIDLALDPGLAFSQAEVNEWGEAVRQLSKFVPIQYIIGKTTFCDLTFEVNENVLIPRPETEALVSWIIADCRDNRSVRILDIGTGSGCIAISLAKNLSSAEVFAIDVSEAALEVAKGNAARNNVSVNFLHQDILRAAALDRYDIVVSNPPYVREMEKEQIAANVPEHEPHLALFVSDGDALVFYDKIASLAIDSLGPGGRLYFEINQYLAKETMDLLERKGFSGLELRKDIFGNHRMIRARI